MKQPCKHCPFRNDVTPFLHPRRAQELAIASLNPYSSFPCHKTTVPDEDSDGGKMMETEDSKECAGFLTLKTQSGIRTPKGFTPAYEICYSEADQMIDAYQQEWDLKYESE